MDGLVRINISPGLTFRILFYIALVLSLIYSSLIIFVDNFHADTWFGPLALFNVNAEVSIPTWYSQFQLLLTAILALFIGYIATSYKAYWFWLSGIFLYLSIDEGSGIHELTSSLVTKTFNLTPGPIFSWILLFGLAFAVIGIIYYRMVSSLPRPVNKLIILGALVFVAGAIGFEIIGSWIASQSGNEKGIAYGLIVGVEEFLEMVGISIFIYALLLYIEKLSGRIEIAVANKTKNPSKN